MRTPLRRETTVLSTLERQSAYRDLEARWGAA